jgi:hypothetical protein
LKITEIREVAVPLRSTLRNSVFDFSEMTTSVVAVHTDVIRSGKPVIGYAFNSTGRYACGEQMRSRLIPRLMKADPESLLDEAGNNFDPAKIYGDGDLVADFKRIQAEFLIISFDKKKYPHRANHSLHARAPPRSTAAVRRLRAHVEGCQMHKRVQLGATAGPGRG